MTKIESKYDVTKIYSRGFCAAMLPEPRNETNVHWLAGYDDGYALRELKNVCMNEYLVKIGHQPIAMVKIK